MWSFSLCRTCRTRVPLWVTSDPLWDEVSDRLMSNNNQVASGPRFCVCDLRTRGLVRTADVAPLPSVPSCILQEDTLLRMRQDEPRRRAEAPRVCTWGGAQRGRVFQAPQKVL